MDIISDNVYNDLFWYSSCNFHIHLSTLLEKYSNSIDINKKNESGRTALTNACYHYHRDTKTVSLLLKQPKIDVNKGDREGSTPLIASCFTSNVEIVKLLLTRSDININQTNNYDNNALHYACWYGYREIAEILIQHGADIDRF